MRGRIRQLKPDLFLDDEFWELSRAHPDMPLLQGFLGLWCQADREGRFEWKPVVLKTQILPYWGGDFGALLESLRVAGFVTAYEICGRRYGSIRSFSKHQRPNSREPESCIPAPLALAQAECVSVHAHAYAPRASQPPLPIPNTQPRTREIEPEPPSIPTVTEIRTLPPVGGSGRTHSLPCEEPPKEFLDEALMRSVTPQQARSTWAHYWGAGLPHGGVEKLYPWLCKRAKERADSLARVTPRAATRGPPPPLPGRPVDEVLAEWAEAEKREEAKAVAARNARKLRQKPA